MSQSAQITSHKCYVSLRIPEEGKNATVHIAHATIPFTEPNVSAALGNNTLIVALPNATGDGSIPQHTSSAQQQYTVVIPDGLYDVEGLQRAINMAVNGVSDPRARGHYYMRPAGSDFSEIGADGSTGSAIAKDDVPNWCTLIPDYETNRLHIRLNYIGSAIFFGDAKNRTTKYKSERLSPRNRARLVRTVSPSKHPLVC